MASVLSVVLFASVIGIFVVTKTLYLTGMTDQEFQRDVDWVMGRMVAGLKEGGARYGLRPAVSFTIPGVTEIDFAGTDGGVRKYYLSANSVVYESPAQTPNVQTIFTAPSGAVVTLRFWEPAGYPDHQTIGIYLAIIKQVSGRNISGSLTTYVNLRNLPK